MHVIYRKTLAKNFRYTSNIYNHRYGCDDEEAKNKNTLELYINKIKMFFVTQNVKPQTVFYLDIVSAGLGYFALVIALAELKCIITNNKKEADVNLDRIDLDTALRYNILDSKRCTLVNKQLPTNNDVLYRRYNISYTHKQCFEESRKNFDDIKGDVLLVTDHSVSSNLISVVLPILTNSNITNRVALGYYDYEQAKHKITHAAIHHNVDQIFLPSCIQKDVKQNLKHISKKFVYFSY